MKDGQSYIEEDDGHKVWIVNGEYHRTDGPAVEWNDGTNFWYLNGKLHREDGPAIEYKSGTKSWYYYGYCAYNEKQFYDPTWRRTIELKVLI